MPGVEKTLQEVYYYFMQIQHELPLIATLAPPPDAVNHGRSDNKQQNETGAVSGPEH